MVDATAQPPEGLSISPDAAKGTALGKRYVDEEGSIELLCIKPGEGSLALGGVALGLKEAKAVVDGAPAPVKEGASKDEAEDIKKQIEEAGGAAELK